MDKFLCSCGSELEVVEDTSLWYDVDPDDGTLKDPHPHDSVGDYKIRCSSPNCGGSFNPELFVNWSLGDTGQLVTEE